MIFADFCSESLDMFNDELNVSILSSSFLQKEQTRRASFVQWEVVLLRQIFKILFLFGRKCHSYFKKAVAVTLLFIVWANKMMTVLVINCYCIVAKLFHICKLF